MKPFYIIWQRKTVRDGLGTGIFTLVSLNAHFLYISKISCVQEFVALQAV